MKKVKTACIIDDDDIFRFIMKKHIVNQDLAENIISFENGEEAIKYLIENAHDSEKLPDVMFLDINMPIMDGWDFITAFNEVKRMIAKDPTIFMISSSVDDRDISRAKDSEVISEYVTKPLDKEVVMQLMSKRFVYS
ncbi:response regulator [bacterium]|nr:response regulator [bacterium]